MIYNDSRYADGTIFNAYQPATGQYQVTVYRNFPKTQMKFSVYQWKDADRIEALAAQYLGSGSLWWKIMDLNPEILDATNIPVGTKLRIPVGI